MHIYLYLGNGPADTHSIATVRVVPSTVRTTVRVVPKRKPNEGKSSNDDIHESNDNSSSSSSRDRGLIGNYTVQRTTHQSRPTVRICITEF